MAPHTVVKIPSRMKICRDFDQLGHLPEVRDGWKEPYPFPAVTTGSPAHELNTVREQTTESSCDRSGAEEDGHAELEEGSGVPESKTAVLSATRYHLAKRSRALTTASKRHRERGQLRRLPGELA